MKKRWKYVLLGIALAPIAAFGFVAGLALGMNSPFWP